jgi:acyl-CoA dehydrogenase
VPIAENEGRSEFGPMVFGSEAALDAHMLHRHGSAAVQARWLAEVAAGRATPSYGMSEPDASGSVPATLQATARHEGGAWCIDGRKWFVCRADRAALVTVLARTRAGAAPGDDLSMIVVPMDSPGVRIERELDVFGRHQGQCEISFTNVRVPADHLLGRVDGGIALMHERLRLGRVLRSCQWLGLAQRSFDLMCRRIRSPRGALAGLADKQLARQHVFEAHLAIAGARALVQAAAAGLDAGRPDDVAVNLAKVAASRALERAADSAVQIHGAEGVSNLTPLSGIYRTARTTRILDGADEALVSATGRRLIDGQAPAAHA